MRNSISLITCCLLLIILGCSKDNGVSDLESGNEEFAAQKANENALVNNNGAIQVSGLGVYAAAGECEPIPDGVAYTVKMTGDLEGCLYAYIDYFDCSPSGTYMEVGREYFVGTYKGEHGTFWTTYRFEAKFEGCANNGAPLGAEILDVVNILS